MNYSKDVRIRACELQPIVVPQKLTKVKREESLSFEREFLASREDPRLEGEDKILYRDRDGHI